MKKLAEILKEIDDGKIPFQPYFVAQVPSSWWDEDPASQDQSKGSKKTLEGVLSTNAGGTTDNHEEQLEPQLFQGIEIFKGFSSQALKSQVKIIKKFVKREKFETKFIWDLPPDKILTLKTSVFKGKLVSCTSPWDFHVIFEDSWIIPTSNEETAWHHIPYSSDPIESKFRMAKLLTVYMDTCKEYKHPLKVELQAYQLVSAFIPCNLNPVDLTKDPLEFNFLCYRAVIIPPEISDELEDITKALGSFQVFPAPSNSNVEKKLVYLLDEGQFVRTSTDFLRPLPIPFTQMPRMARRCTLNGVSPVGKKWTRSSIQFMRNVLSDQELTVEVINKLRLCSVHPYIWQPTLIEVTLMFTSNSKTASGSQDHRQKRRIECDEENVSVRLNVSQLLIDFALAIQWNPFYPRPDAARNLPREASLGLQPTDLTLHESELPVHVIKREEKRVRTYLQQMGRHCDSSSAIVIGNFDSTASAVLPDECPSPHTTSSSSSSDEPVFTKCVGRGRGRLFWTDKM